MRPSTLPSGRAHALLAWLSATLLLGLILLLAGALPGWGVLDDFFSVSAAASVLVVFALACAEIRSRAPWSMLAAVLGLTGLTLVLVGDALQHVVFHGGDGLDGATLWAATTAVRDGLGNSLFYAGLVVLGAVFVGQGRRWLGILAIANGVLGYLDLAFAASLGLPPHTNFLLLVVWEIGLGTAWWRFGRDWTAAAELDRTAAPSSRRASSNELAAPV